MHSCLLLCIELLKCDRNHDINVIVICDMCALYFQLFICHVTCVMLICFSSAFYSDANEFYYSYLGMKTDRIRTDITDIIFVFTFLVEFGFEYG